MAGSYCNYCDRRCFVYREVIVGGQRVWSGHMATCGDGRAHDKRVLGVDYTQAYNPYAAEAGRATASASQRIWIDPGGMTLCDRHAGHYLRSAIEHSPRARWHQTPRGDWLADDSGQFTCETCANDS